MNKIFSQALLAFCFVSNIVLADTSASGNQLGQSQEPLAIQSGVELTQAEIDAAFSRIPPEKRLPFIRDGGKVEVLVQNLLRNKILAEEARKAEYDKDTMVSLRLSLTEDKELAQEWLEKVVKDAPEVDYEAIAYEKYLLKPEAWKTEDRIDVSHILISSETRSAEAAKEQAMLLWEELQADPTRFDAMVEEYSEDPSKNVNGGRFPSVGRNDMVEPFEIAAFALEEAGEISLPVETNYGFHIIRLNQKIPGTVSPFEDIQAIAMQQVREKYLEDYKARYLKKTLSGPIELPEGAVVKMAKRYFGEDLELAPEFRE